jgi:hypothetical protein
MNDPSNRDVAAGLDGDDTEELLALKIDDPSGDGSPAHGDASSTDSWRVEPLQRRDLEREAELGTLRLNIASVTQSHEHLENSLRGLTMNLRDLEERLAARSAELASKERALTAREVQITELQRELAAARAHASDAESRLATLAQDDEARRQAQLVAEQRVAELQQSLQALEASQAELQAQHERTLAGSEDLRRDLREQLEQLLAERERERSELRIAEERLRAADSELRSRDQRIERLTAAEGTLKSRTEELGRQLAERDALVRRLDQEAESSAAVLGKIQSNLTRLDKEESAMPRDLVARLLVRNDGNTEIVQVLGRRTLIGRGVDCQLQIDAEFVSRRHALVLVSPDETVIEDLNSTNGVFVNGLRVARRRLAEGDQVMVGKTLFRYVVKPMTDRGG